MTRIYSPWRLTFVALTLFVFLMPPLWLFLSSLKSQQEIFQWPPTIFPAQPTLQNFIDTVSRAKFLIFFRNSAVVSVLSALISVTISVMAGYALAKFRFKGDTLFFLLIMSSLMVPLQIIMIPVFLVLRDLNLLDTLAGIISDAAIYPQHSRQSSRGSAS
jgi:alpha-1,4-digalacturonate transport system permease protein